MKHQLPFIVMAALLLLSTSTFSQSVGIGTESPNSNAILELVAPDNNQGLLVPRMTTAERTATSFITNLSASDNGLMVYDEDTNKFFFWINDHWVELASGNLNGLPDQAGQSGKILSTDGNTAVWSELDFNSLTNLPTGLDDGDDNTQLSEAEIEAFGFVKTSEDADNDPSNEDQTVSAGAGISIIQTGENFQVTNDSPDQTIILTDGGSGNVTIAGTYPNLSIDVADPSASEISVNTTTDLSSSNVQDALEELQGKITTAANASIVDGSITTSKLASLAVTNEKINDVDFSKLTSVPSGLADGDDVDDADSDPDNENQTVSAGTGISISQTGDDFEVTNTSPDQTVIITDGGSGNVTIGGTYPNLTVDVPSLNDADADPTNENQTVSAGTGISISQTDDDFEVTNTLPDQTVVLKDGGNGNITIAGTYPNFTIDVPDNNDNSSSNEIQDISTNGTAGNISISSGTTLTLNIDDADASSTNEIELPTQTSQNGNFLTTDGTSPSWSSITESQWSTNGSSINYSTGGVNIGSSDVPSAQLEIVTTTETNTIEVNNNFIGVGSKTGIDINVGNQGTANKTGIHTEIIATATSTGSLSGTINEIEPANGSAIGTSNTIDSNGTGLRFGTYNTINAASGNSSDIYGYRAQLTHSGTGDTYAFSSQDFGTSSGTEYGVFLFGEDLSYFSGNVGIGEADPSAKLDVIGDTELNGELTVTDDIEIPATSDYTYASAKTKVASYHPSEFQVLNVAGIEEDLMTPNSVSLHVSFSGGTGGLAFATAPVKLPDNAIVTQLEAWVVDNSASEFARVTLNRNQIGLSNANLSLALVETDDPTQSATVTQLTDNTIFSGSIDNSTYAYYLTFTSSGSNDPEIQLHGVKITYTISEVD